MTIVGNVEILGLNPLVRHGMRSKENVTAVEIVRKKDPKMDVSGILEWKKKLRKRDMPLQTLKKKEFLVPVPRVHHDAFPSKRKEYPTSIPHRGGGGQERISRSIPASRTWSPTKLPQLFCVSGLRLSHLSCLTSGRLGSVVHGLITECRRSCYKAGDRS